MNATYVLWRGNVLLGRFSERGPVTRHGEPVGASGILEPTEAMVGMSSIWQIGAREAPGFPAVPAIQHALEADVMGRPMGPRPPSSGALEPVETPPVPADQMLRVETEAGDTVVTSSIVLQLSMIPDGMDPAEVRLRDGLPDGGREVWIVSFGYIKP
jgi:hypothetical protein